MRFCVSAGGLGANALPVSVHASARMRPVQGEKERGGSETTLTTGETMTFPILLGHKEHVKSGSSDLRIVLSLVHPGFVPEYVAKSIGPLGK